MVDLYMNQYRILLITICFIIGIGITSAESIPNLTGTWVEEKLTCVTYDGTITNLTSEEKHWIITQHDDLIQGTNYFKIDDKIVEEPIAGVISPDGKLANVVDKSGGTYNLYVDDNDTLTVHYVNTGDKREENGYAFAFSQVLKRSI